MDLGPAVEPVESNLNTLAEVTFIEPIPTSLVSAESDPAELAVQRDTIRLAFVAALQHLPARQRAVLILCEVLRWKASEVAELLDTSVASVNSALQRARATIEEREIEATDAVAPMDAAQREFLERYVDAFQRYDVEALTALLREDASQSMPPFDLWLSGREDVLTWWFGPGIGCRGSRVIPVEIGQRLDRLRPVQAERVRQRLRPVGAPGARDRRRQDRGVHVLPLHRAPVPAVGDCRRASTPRAPAA